ncbi:ethanolamine utilization protein EutJ family protein [Thermanaerovibrio velox DSM 12556]|uniref:Ethanolamine utilization protein EutJ family protein n=1 Tax=Thermanaerovibrio velox DSM 12556 TaxID=926567 RepID=H0UQ82_9BACT|nr:ethanolamine utilization protein EutJ [Thermanaerovibrio velox]EHM10720.1 ethanolamine utilization protein EutJ family protein [Thermanaerovibrio velox DSM 12556]
MNNLLGCGDAPAVIERVNRFLEGAFRTREEPLGEFSCPLMVGVDLGTASVVLAVVDLEGRVVSWEMEEASVVRDGLVVDFAGAAGIVRRLKGILEERLGVELEMAAVAVPPGTSSRDSAAHRYVAEGAGFNVQGVLDEPTAANLVLGVSDGAVVDIGGGTTGIALFRDGKLVSVADEPTGGTHVSLVIAGNRGISLEDAEALKRDPRMQSELMPVVKPVFQKMGTIIKRFVGDDGAGRVFLVGGTCSFSRMDQVISAEVGLPAFVPSCPFLVTPLGIALGCPVQGS